MKRFMILTLMVLCLLIAVVAPAHAVDAVTSTGFGWLTQESQSSTTVYTAGFDINVVEKLESGFVLKNETSYLYSDGFGEDEGDIQVLRIYAVSEKDILSGIKPLVKIGDPVELKWRLYFGIGAGTWQFIKTGLDGDDQAYGALITRIGGSYNSFNLSLNLEMVQMDGPDIIAPMVNFAFDF